jgi:hypothetical protein
MIFHISSDVLGHIQGFLPHLLVDELVLVPFQALSLLSPEISEGLVEIIQQTLGKKAEDKQNGHQRDYSPHYSQQQDLTGEPLENRVV